MIAIPEIRVTLITPPRTASTSLWVAVQDRYPEACRLHRHMEHGKWNGYNHDYICVDRDPLSRMLSTYHYMREYETTKEHHYKWMEDVRRDTNRSFEEWLLNSTHPFATDCLNPVPITKKSIEMWAGDAELMSLFNVECLLDLTLPCLNPSNHISIEPTDAVRAHMDKYHYSQRGK